MTWKNIAGSIAFIYLIGTGFSISNLAGITAIICAGIVALKYMK